MDADTTCSDRQALQELLEQIGPQWARDINHHRDRVIQAYTPWVQRFEDAATIALRDLAYGDHPRQVLDVFHRPGVTSRDVIVFFHGGAFVRGQKSGNGHIYDNVCHWFERHGVVAVNVEYRLAPEAPYPAGAEDVALAVTWVQQHISAFGGNPKRIFVVGHSAGGCHVASALFDPACTQFNMPACAGAILISARLWADVLPDNPNAAGVQAYFGDDPCLYEQRSPLTHAGRCRLPLMVAIAEFENPHLDEYGREFFRRVKVQAGAAHIRFVFVDRHNHTSIVAHFNSGDDTLGPAILDFMLACN